MKRCGTCKQDLPEDVFGKCSRAKDGLMYRCKPCDREFTLRWRESHRDAHREMCKKWNANNPNKVKENVANFNQNNRAKRTAQERNRVAKKKNATPPWYNEVEVEYIYELARDRGLEVDHIVPLTSSLVCGLHVQDNLRCIPPGLNRSKSNRYWADMP